MWMIQGTNDDPIFIKFSNFECGGAVRHNYVNRKAVPHRWRPSSEAVPTPLVRESGVWRLEMDARAILLKRAAGNMG